MDITTGALSVFLITLGLGQLSSTHWRLRGLSLVGPGRLAGYGLGTLLLLAGALTLPDAWPVLGWTLPAGPLVVVLLLVGGSFVAPPRHPDWLFSPDHPAHAGCQPVQIPHGNDSMPALLLRPRLSSVPQSKETADGLAVCIIPGAGDNKTFFKWRQVQALLAEGLTVLTIDPPGHGDYRRRPMAYPDCLSAVPAAVEFLRRQPGVSKVGLIGISLGGALAIRYLAQAEAANTGEGGRVEALVILATPAELNYNRLLFYREAWHTYRAPVLSLLREISFRQIWQSWRTGGYRSRHSTAELIALLNPLANIGRLKDIPILLVYGRRDQIAPPAAAQAMQQAAPWATLLESKKASHVTLILIPEINRAVARWLKAQLAV